MHTNIFICMNFPHTPFSLFLVVVVYCTHTSTPAPLLCIHFKNVNRSHHMDCNKMVQPLFCVHVTDALLLEKRMEME